MESEDLESRILGCLKSPSSSPQAARDVETVASELGVHVDSVRRAVESLKAQGLIETQRDERLSYRYTKKGLQDLKDGGLPEIRLLVYLSSNGPRPAASLPPQFGMGLSIARKEGYISIDAGQLSITSVGEAIVSRKHEYELPAEGQLDSAAGREKCEKILMPRGLVEQKASSKTTLTLTQKGRQTQRAPPAPSSSSIGAIDRAALLSGAWKHRPFRPYDLKAEQAAAPAQPARRHPISALRGRIGRIFTDLGFEEMRGPHVESTFWNFDALFQPQDHPARDLADTFYLEGSAPLPHGLADAVRRSHEKSWLYEWKESEAKRRLLRTHTTAVSARTLVEEKDDPRPRKFFSIGKVFRNEATDYKHLAEFYQVEGIISWEGAHFRHLLGVLKEFYSRLGFQKIRFRPSFFPYTEPSLEIEVFHPARQAWLELGGAGVLRPEVSEPLCGKYPVLAWGLSLERPLMLANKIEDIRTLYRNDLNWLRDFPVSD